jgi:glycosyltransferase involved in cell wall biosynthesis
MEFVGRKHSLYSGFFENPPTGYRFVESKGLWTSIARENLSPNRLLVDTVLELTSRWMPLNLFSGLAAPFASRVPHDMLYSSGHVIWRNEPWVVDLEMASHLAGYRTNHLMRYARILRSRLESENCRGILVWTDAARESLLRSLKANDLESKIWVVRLAVPSRPFFRKMQPRLKKVLFVGSTNFPADFHHKGGKEVLRAFENVSRERNDVEFIMRSIIPSEFSEACKRMRNLTLIQELIPWHRMEELFASADVFVFPSHQTPAMVFLDAMSYGLPIVTTDVWANREMVLDGMNGILVDPPDEIRYEDEFRNPLWGEREIVRKIRHTTFETVVVQTADAINRLLDDDTLRKRMGEAGRQMTTEGVFSVRNRNDSLVRFLDMATQEK